MARWAMGCLAVCAAARAPRSPVTRPLRVPILMLHPHKAGGSSLCAYFKEFAPVGMDTGNCACLYKDPALAATEAWMRRGGVSFCNIEHVVRVPTAADVRASAARLRVLVTLRDPWSTYISNYKRAYHKVPTRASPLVPAPRAPRN